MTPERRPHRPNDPVVVGVGQHLDRSVTAPEPALLMAEAARLAAADAGVDASASEVVAAVPTFSWRYADPGRIVAEQIGAAGAHTWTAVVGGNTPQLLMNRLAAEIAAGRLDQAVLCGGEADATKRAARRSGGDVPWPRQDLSITPDWSDGGEFVLAHPAEHERRIFWPTQAYPLFETALWHASGRSLGEHLGRIGELWAGLSRVAAANPYAWRREPHTADGDHHADRRQPDGRLPLHQADGGEPRRGHVLGGDRLLGPAGRAARGPAGPLGLRPCRHRRCRPHACPSGPTSSPPRRCASPGAGSSSSPGSRSTRWRTSTCTPASPQRSSWRWARSASPRTASSASPAG